MMLYFECYISYDMVLLTIFVSHRAKALQYSKSILEPMVDREQGVVLCHLDMHRIARK